MALHARAHLYDDFSRRGIEKVELDALVGYWHDDFYHETKAICGFVCCLIFHGKNLYVFVYTYESLPPPSDRRTSFPR